MWIVQFASLKVQNEVEALKNKKLLTDVDQRIIKTWIMQMQLDGPESIRKNPVWNDHDLQNDWEGFRSSSFSNKGRIIYKVEDRKVLIQIERITIEHDYRRKHGKKT